MTGWLGYPRITANPANYASGRQGYRDIWFVVHCTDDTYTDNYPSNLGKYWQNTTTSVSVHFCVSDTQVRQYVSMDDTAFQARNPGNLRGVGVELCGLSRWTRNEWLAHKPMLIRAAQLCAEVAMERDYDLTPRKLSPAALKTRRSGLTQHADLTGAFGGSHTDLGPAFPWDFFTGELNRALNRTNPQNTITHATIAQAAHNTIEEDTAMAVSDADFKALQAQVKALYDVIVDGRAWRGSSIAANLGYVVGKVNAVGQQVDAAMGHTTTTGTDPKPPLTATKA